jgi:molybdopterin synthase sulfur carrier subunit
MKVKVLFFGILTELVGKGIKYYEDVKSLEQLKQRVEEDYPEIVHYKFKISLNNIFINGDKALKNGDEVAFLPPFAGG